MLTAWNLFCVEAACSPRGFSLCVGSLWTHTPKTCIWGSFEPQLAVGVNVCVYARPSVYVGPTRSWWLIQGAPRLSPEGSWDGLQSQALRRWTDGYLKWVGVCVCRKQNSLQSPLYSGGHSKVVLCHQCVIKYTVHDNFFLFFFL